MARPFRPFAVTRAGPNDHLGVLLSTYATSVILAATEGHEGEGGFHTPSISDFFPSAILFEGTIFQIDRIWIIRIGEEILGKENAKRFVPMLTTIFLSILAFNLTSVIPGLNLAGTSRIGIPLLLALWVFVTYWAVGIRKHGLGGYLKANLFPPGVPWPIYFILTPIELLQLLIIRPGSLADWWPTWSPVTSCWCSASPPPSSSSSTRRAPASWPSVCSRCRRASS
jgi:F-type H+-transporting ATPase subunit a